MYWALASNLQAEDGLDVSLLAWPNSEHLPIAVYSKGLLPCLFFCCKKRFPVAQCHDIGQSQAVNGLHWQITACTVVAVATAASSRQSHAPVMVQSVSMTGA